MSKVELTQESKDVIILEELERHLGYVVSDIKKYRGTGTGELNKADWKRLKKGLKIVISYYGGNTK